MQKLLNVVVFALVVCLANGCATEGAEIGTGSDEVNAGEPAAGGIGESCHGGEDCADDLTCVVKTGQQGVTPGTCKKPLPEGEACDESLTYECEAGLFCQPNMHEGRLFMECRPNPNQS